MKKEDKVRKIAELGEIIKEYAHFYLVDVTAMDAAATSAMRAKCFKQEIEMVVVKNTLLHKAFEASEIDFSPLYPCLKGTTASCHRGRTARTFRAGKRRAESLL